MIASLAKQAREEGIDVMVVTGDRDAYQLVGDGIRVMSTSRGITETKIYDVAAVEERYGVPPTLITDLMGLRGDTSDNIPGVPGSVRKPPPSCCRNSARSTRCWKASTRSPAPNAKKTSPTTPTTRGCHASWRRCRCTTSRPGWTSPAPWSPSPTAPRCGTS